MGLLLSSARALRVFRLEVSDAVLNFSHADAHLSRVQLSDRHFNESTACFWRCRQRLVSRKLQCHAKSVRASPGGGPSNAQA